MGEVELQKGQKLKLSDLTGESKLEITVSAKLKAGEADSTCFGVDSAGKLSDDRYFIFYNQLATPENAVVMRKNGENTVFAVDLSLLPDKIQKLVVTVAADGALMRDLENGYISLSAGGEKAEYHFSGSGFKEEKALILCELYRKDTIWRYTVVASGFNGGLNALLAHFGGEEAAPAAPAPSPKPAAPVPPQKGPESQPAPPASQPAKINLKKSGDSHKINLSKNSGEIHVNLNWNAGKKGLFSSGAKVDLDLACMFRLKNGMQGVIQALGNSFGNANDLPYILLDQDDRTGNSAAGENMFFKRPELIDFAVVFAYIYEGVPNWRRTDAGVTLKQQGEPDIEIRIDSPDSRNRFCVLASLSGSDGQLTVKREEQFFPGHREVDQHYGFGFKWVAGKK